MKKFLVVLLVLTLVLASVPAFASAKAIAPNEIYRPYYCAKYCGYGHYGNHVCYGAPVVANLPYWVPGAPCYTPVYRPCPPVYKAPAIILNPELIENVETGFVKTVTANTLNVRAGAGTSYEVLGSLSKGTTVLVKSYSGNWAVIEYGNGYAYISATYLK